MSSVLVLTKSCGMQHAVSILTIYSSRRYSRMLSRNARFRKSYEIVKVTKNSRVPAQGTLGLFVNLSPFQGFAEPN